jgi:hypothetical protein
MPNCLRTSFCHIAANRFHDIVRRHGSAKYIDRLLSARFTNHIPFSTKCLAQVLQIIHCGITTGIDPLDLQIGRLLTHDMPRNDGIPQQF